MMIEQAMLPGMDAMRRPRWDDRAIDWDSVTGMDLANDERLAVRYSIEVNRPFGQKMRRWLRQRRRG